MFDAVKNDGRIVACLREDERALEYSLGVTGEARRVDLDYWRVGGDGCGEVGFEGRGMSEDACGAGVANGKG